MVTLITFFIILQIIGVCGLMYVLMIHVGLIHEKNLDTLSKYLFYFTKEERDKRKDLKERKKLRDVFKHGTDDEKVRLHNQVYPHSKILTINQLKEKYKGLDFSKVIITDLPSNLFDPIKNIIANDYDPLYIGIKLTANVQTYTEIDIQQLNKSECIIIHRVDDINYRYITKEDIIEQYPQAKETLKKL